MNSLSLKWVFGSLSMLTLFWVPNNSFAFWDQGHETIAEIAQEELTVKTQKEVDQLLKVELKAPGSQELSQRMNKMVSASVWADFIKQPIFHANSGVDEYGSNCHFINVSIDKDEIPLFPQSKEKRDEIRARLEKESAKESRSSLSCTRFAIQILMSGEPVARKALALRYLIHLVGDIHQPLHNFSISTSHSPTGNRGGVELKIPTYSLDVFSTVKKKGGVVSSVSNLHSLWDAGLGLFPQFSYISIHSPKDLAKVSNKAELNHSIHIAKVSKESELISKGLRQQILDMESQDLGDWAFESLEVGMNAAYAGIDLSHRDFPMETSFLDEQAYFRYGQIQLARQVVRAGYRLGFLLNALFDPDHASQPFVKLIKVIAPDSPESAHSTSL